VVLLARLSFKRILQLIKTGGIAMSTQLSIEKEEYRVTPDNARAQLLAEIPVTERKLQLAGISTTVLEGGEGEPVILLHGPGESSLWWMRVIPQLAETHHVIVPDLPGHGASEVDAGELDTRHVFAWLDELIEHTCSSTPVLVGHLLGGGIAARFAISNSERIQQLVLVDSFGLAKFRPSPKFAFGLVKFLMRPNERTYAKFLPHCMYDANSLQIQMGKNWQLFLVYNLDRARDPNAKAALRFFMGQFAVSKIPEEKLAAIEAPVDLIWGRHDKALNLKIAEAASKRFGWRLHVIEDSRDDPKLEQPVQFLNALYSAIKRNESNPEERIAS
jgi:pimeloyl-ACP methyl ester carboxylesterase